MYSSGCPIYASWVRWCRLGVFQSGLEEMSAIQYPSSQARFIIFKNDFRVKIGNQSPPLAELRLRQLVGFDLRLRPWRNTGRFRPHRQLAVTPPTTSEFELIEKEASYATAVKKIKQSKSLLSFMNCCSWWESDQFTAVKIQLAKQSRKGQMDSQLVA